MMKSYFLIRVATTVAMTFLFKIGLFSQTNPGDIMFVGFNADGNDGFAVVALFDIPANSTYYFTDNEWNGQPIGAGGDFNNYNEGELTWDTGASIITAGTVVVFTDTRVPASGNYGSSEGTISGSINLNTTNEVLYCYIGANAMSPSGFISAFGNRNFTISSGTLDNTGLVDGDNALATTGQEDVMVYDGITECSGTVADCAQQIATNTNWSGQDGGGDQNNDGTYPDYPDDVPPFFFGTALPIELESFNLENQYDKQVLISWTTLSEIENDYFTIERSIDGSNWKVLERISGAGNSTIRLNYTTLDGYPQQGVNYYRLKQTDFNGDFTYFDIESVTIKDPLSLSVYPNPAARQITISAKGLNPQEVLFYNSIGNQVWLDAIEVATLKSTQMNNSYNTSKLKPGIYFVRVGSGDSSQFSTFIKN